MNMRSEIEYSIDITRYKPNLTCVCNYEQAGHPYTNLKSLLQGKKDIPDSDNKNYYRTNWLTAIQSFLTVNRHRDLVSLSVHICIRIKKIFLAARVKLKAGISSAVIFFEQQYRRIKLRGIYPMPVSNLKIDLQVFQSTH
jgi:hypothetical protein